MGSDSNGILVGVFLDIGYGWTPSCPPPSKSNLQIFDVQGLQGVYELMNHLQLPCVKTGVKTHKLFKLYSKVTLDLLEMNLKKKRIPKS